MFLLFFGGNKRKVYKYLFILLLCMLEQLLKDPEKYRDGPNYRATNIVFPVRFRGSRLIAKKPRILSSLIEGYYSFQDLCFYRTRRLSTSYQRFQREARCLEKLGGFHSPILIAHDRRVLVREYLEGRDFRKLQSGTERRRALRRGFEALMEMHGKGVAIGDAHVKNLFLSGGATYWIDFGGVFDESDFLLSRAVDCLKFVYSTYSVTRDYYETIFSAEIVSKRIGGEIKRKVREIATPGHSSIRLWFPVRVPLSGRLNKEIKKILRS